MNPPNAIDVDPRALPRLCLISYREGPCWEPGKTLQEQDLGTHLNYMRELFGEGRLFAAGPIPTANGGLVIVASSSEAEARDIMANDPAVKKGIFRGDVQTWIPLLNSDEPLVGEKAN